MNIIRTIAITFAGLVIMTTPMIITTTLIISHDPVTLMGGTGVLLYVASLMAGIGLVFIADRAMNRS